jgi:hypothetical protein
MNWGRVSFFQKRKRFFLEKEAKTFVCLVGFIACSVPALAAPVSPVPAVVCPSSGAGGDAVEMPHLAAALQPGGMLALLAIGTVNAPEPAAGATPAAPSGLPWQVARALEAAVHGLHVSVTALGGHGLTAGQMLDRLRAELPRKAYRLVLWQTGTVEAVGDMPPEDFYQSLADGAAAAQAAGADLVLIDPQYSRFLEGNANLAPYFQALQAAGTLPGVMLFHRFDTMHDWVAAGTFDLEHTARADRPAVAARLHACLARVLAKMLVAGGAG